MASVLRPPDVSSNQKDFALEPAAGERVLEVGCGTGGTTADLAKAVGAKGHVLGADISEPLVEAARARGLGNATFEVADATTHAFEPASFDLVFSRFGVMFFDNPPAAFANIRKGLKPGGRLAFVCWRPAMENEWVTVPAAAARPHLPPQPPPDPLAPGPFAFADPVSLKSILSGAGFRDVQAKKLDGVMNLGTSSDEAAFQMTNLGPLSRALGEVEDQAIRDRVRVAAFGPGTAAALQAGPSMPGVKLFLAVSGLATNNSSAAAGARRPSTVRAASVKRIDVS